MIHNATFYIDGEWWLIETLKTGERFAVSESRRLPFGELVAMAARALSNTQRK